MEDEALFGPSDNLLEEADTEEEDIDIYGLAFKVIYLNLFSGLIRAFFAPFSHYISLRLFSLAFCSRRGEKRNKFVLNVRTTVRNGLLIWMNQGPTLQGDFLAVAVIEGRIELSFNLGKKTQPIRITSNVRGLVCA